MRLVSTMGTSPGVVYETLLNLCRGSYEAGESGESTPFAIQGVTIVYTSNSKVVAAYRVARLLVACSGTIFRGTGKELPPECRIREVSGAPLGIDDVASRKEYNVFSEKIDRILGRGDVIDVSGGRAAMAVAATLKAIDKNAVIVASAVPSNLYTQLGGVFNNIIKNYDLEQITRRVYSEGCNALEEYGELKKLLQELVTGQAKTFILYS